MSGKKNNKDELKEIANQTAGVFSNSIASLIIAFGVMMAVAFIGRHFFTLFLGYDEPPEWFGNLAFALFIGFIFSEPYEAWKAKKLSYRVLGKFALGTLFGMSLFFFDLSGEGSKEVVDPLVGDSQESSAGDEKRFSILFFWPVIIPLLMMPILFGSHALDRFEKNKKASLKERVADAALEYINTSGPIIMMLVMGVCALFYWLVGMPFNMLIAFLTTIVIGITLYCAVFYDGSEEPVTEEDYVAPRSKTFGAGLTTVLDVSVKMLPGVLIMTGLIWVAIAFWDFTDLKKVEGADIDVIALIWSVMKASIIGIVVVPGGILLANLAGGLGIAGWAQLKGMGMSEVELRANKFNEMLYGGAMGKLFHGSLEKIDE